MEFFLECISFSLTKREDGYLLTHNEGERLLSSIEHEKFQDSYREYIHTFFGEGFKRFKSDLQSIYKKIDIVNNMKCIKNRHIIVSIPKLDELDEFDESDRKEILRKVKDLTEGRLGIVVKYL